MLNLREQLVTHLDVAGARVGSPTHLTTTELVERVDAERVEELSTPYLPLEIEVTVGPK